jgi:hypothetical protein
MGLRKLRRIRLAPYDDVVAELNRAGTEGWELVDVATLDTGNGGRSPDQEDWPLTRYTFRRPSASAPVKSTELVQQAESPRWQPIRISQPADSQDGGLAGPGTAESATLVRFTVFCKPDSGSGSDAGRLQIKCEVAHPWSQADIDEIGSLRSAYKTTALVMTGATRSTLLPRIMQRPGLRASSPSPGLIRRRVSRSPRQLNCCMVQRTGCASWLRIPWPMLRQGRVSQAPSCLSVPG